ncbi:3-oxoacyl-[acyl-carrier-protein] synthase I, chloroplastic-like protein [Tanacetum coccineum]
MGLVSVFGSEVDTFYTRLLAGDSGIRLIDRFDTSGLTTKFGGQIRGFESNGYIDAKYDKKLDDCQRYCLVAGKKALEDAALGRPEERSKIDKERAGVLVCSGMGGGTIITNGAEALLMRGYRKISPFFSPFMTTNMGPALLAMDLGFSVPNYSIFASCATSNYCLSAAANHIRHGDVDLMIAGGVESSVIPFGLGGFAASKALSRRNHDPQTASRPWDKERDGFVMESLEHAMKRGAPLLSEYLGGAIIVNYINAHATSTPIGDLAEDPEPAVDFNTVANHKQQHEINVAISTSFGVGGHNSVVAFAAFKP